MNWDYKSKLLLYEKFKEKFETFRDMKLLHSWLTEYEAKIKNKPRTNPKKWNEYLDELGCIRIIRSKKTGWEYEDNPEPKEFGWKSLNTPGFVHISNPIWPGTFHQSDHILRINKEIAEKVLVLGLP